MNNTEDILKYGKLENLELFSKNSIENKQEFWYILQNYDIVLDFLKDNNLLINKKNENKNKNV